MSEAEAADPSAFYTRERVIGKGGFATTWLATDTRSGKPCALKQLHLQQIDNWKDLEGFEREIRTLKHLDHPGIPRLLDSWQKAEPPEAVLVQEYVPGRSLQQWVEDGRRFSEAEALEVLIQLAGILAYLHSFTNPVIHRDIKPSNLMLEERPDKRFNVWLIDFGGVARNLAGQGLTVTGTFGYMPLEQIEGHAVPASDLYALGAAMIYLLTGQAPADLKKKGLKPDFRAYAQLSTAFAKILDKLIEPELAKRYSSASVLQADLLRLLPAKKSEAPSAKAGLAFSPLAAARTWGQILVLKRFLPVAGLVILLLVGVGFWLGRRPSSPPRFKPASQLIRADSLSWRPAPVKSWQQLTPSPKISQLAQGPDGSVWGVSDSKFYLLSGSQVQSWDYHELTDSYSSLTFLTSPAAGEAWFGTFDGRLFRWQGQHAQAIPLPGKLTALVSWKGQPVAATDKRIWQWQAQTKQFVRLGELPEDKVERLFVSGEQLWAACNSHLYAYATTGFQPAFQGKLYDEKVHSLVAGPQHLWLGLENGLVEKDLSRNLMARLGNTGPVTGLVTQSDKVPNPDILSISTAIDATGLARLSPDSSLDDSSQHLGWREGLPDDRFKALLLDAQQNLWLSADSGELWRAPLTAVEQEMSLPETKLIPALRFEDACKAWDGLKPGNTPTLAADRQSGSLKVYWHRQQICPAGDGFRRDDGAVLSKTWDSLELREKGQLTKLPLPEKYVSVESLLLAQNGDIWLSRSYPYLVDHASQGRWQKPADLSSQYAVALTQTRSGDMLAVTKVDAQLVLQRFDPQAQTWQGRVLLKEPSGMTPNIATLAAPQLQAETALATSNGLYLLKPNAQELRQVTNLPYTDIDMVAEDKQGRLWIIYLRYGKGRGLSVWNPATGQVKHLDSRQGLVPDRFKDLSFDSQGRLWLLHHDNQVSVYKPAELESAMMAIQ